jgi:enamine deaminase RidA (YjgF/YER057c/UK114 family)
MAGLIDKRLRELQITLPEPAAPAANYVPYVLAGSLVHVAGQVPVSGKGLEFQGKVGVDFSIEEGQQAARLCALNIIAQIRAAAGGDLDRVHRIVKLGGFVNCPPEFDQHPKVINGASDLMVEVFGDRGRHARFAVGAPSLPFNVAVEIDAVAELA